MTLARPLRTQCVDGNADCCIWEQSGYMGTHYADMGTHYDIGTWATHYLSELPNP
jgi:hypothetical protein